MAEQGAKELLLELVKLRQRVAELEAADAERRRLEKELRWLREFNERIVQSMIQGVVLEDADGYLTFVNPAAAAMLGYSPQELVGRHWTTIVPPDQHPSVQAANERRRHGEAGRYELQLIRKDGRGVPVLISSSPRIEEGRFAGTLVIFTDITERKRAEEELRRSFERLQRTFEEAVHALASAIKIRDPYTASHQQRVAQLAYAIAQEMGLPEEQIKGIRVAGLLHDIGKIKIPAEILSKLGGLTEHEYGLIKAHPRLGYEILKTIEFPWPVAQIVLQHHERMDGSGYPQGLLGEEIMLEARILGVAEVVDAISSHHPYRPARTIDEALDEVLRNTGVLYDAEVVNACLTLFLEKKFKFQKR